MCTNLPIYNPHALFSFVPVLDTSKLVLTLGIFTPSSKVRGEVEETPGRCQRRKMPAASQNLTYQ